MSVNLPHRFKGTYAIRFIEVPNQHQGEVKMSTLPIFSRALKSKLSANPARIKVEYPHKSLFEFFQ